MIGMAIKSISHDHFMREAMLGRGRVRKVGEGRFGARQVIFDGGLKAVLKPKLHSTETYRGISRDTQYLREAAAYQLDWKLLHFDIIPPATLTMFQGQPASIAYWVSGLTATGVVPKVFNRKLDGWQDRVALFAAKVDVDALRKLCIFDLIVNNTDRHAKNCVFDPFVSRVWGIDHGLTFGRNFGYYYNVFHRFLFRNKLKLTSEERARLSGITHEQLIKALGRFLSPREIAETHLRLQWVLAQPDLGFKLISEGHDGKDAFPARAEWFRDQLKQGPRNRVMARVEAMGSPLLLA